MNAMGTPADAQAPTAEEQADGGEAQGETELAASPDGTSESGIQPESNDAIGSPPQPAELDGETTELLTRFLMGFLLWGGDELMVRLREIQQEIETNPESLGPTTSPDETTLDLLRYLAIGAILRGQKRAAKGVHNGLMLSLGSASWAVGKLDHWTDNWLFRPIRRPIESRLQDWGREADRIAQEGRLEDQRTKMLATGIMGEITDDMIDLLAQDPELHQAIREQVAKQSVGLATVVADNTRTATVIADGIAESVVRRLLRRAPREDLPPSPLEGQPQTMYEPETTAKELEEHE